MAGICCRKTAAKEHINQKEKKEKLFPQPFLQITNMPGAKIIFMNLGHYVKVLVKILLSKHFKRGQYWGFMS